MVPAPAPASAGSKPRFAVGRDSRWPVWSGSRLWGVLASLTDDQRLEACGADPGPVCDWVSDRTTSVWVARATDLLVDRPLQILLILVVALVVSRVGRRLVTRAVRRVAGRSVRSFNAIERQRRSGRLGPLRGQRADHEGDPAGASDPRLW